MRNGWPTDSRGGARAEQSTLGKQTWKRDQVFALVDGWTDRQADYDDDGINMYRSGLSPDINIDKWISNIEE